MEGDTSPFCSTYGEYLNVKHIMENCRAFQKEITLFLIYPYLVESLSPDPSVTENLLTFLKYTKLYNLIEIV